MADITDDIAALRHYSDNMAAARMEQIADRIRRVVDECERLQKDAARYRWLRDRGDGTWPPFAKRAGTENGALVDAAIDKAIAAMQEQPK